MDELDLPDTRALFLESGAAALEDAKAKHDELLAEQRAAGDAEAAQP